MYECSGGLQVSDNGRGVLLALESMSIEQLETYVDGHKLVTPEVWYALMLIRAKKWKRDQAMRPEDV